MNIQLKKGVLELVVMNEISRGDQYGYELSQTISKHLSIADGTLYPMFRRLVNEGMLDTYMGKTSAGPARKYYTITSTGRLHLQHLTEEWMELKSSVNELLEGADNNEQKGIFKYVVS